MVEENNTTVEPTTTPSVAGESMNAPVEQPQATQQPNQQAKPKRLYFWVGCTRNRNTAYCSWLFSLRTKYQIAGKCESKKVGPKSYRLYPAKYLVIKWDYWNKAVPPHLITIYLMRLSEEKGVEWASGAIQIGFDKIENILPKLDERLRRIVHDVYQNTPEYHTCVDFLNLSVDDVAYLVEKLRKLRRGTVERYFVYGL